MSSHHKLATMNISRPYMYRPPHPKDRSHNWGKSLGAVARKLYTPARTAPRNPYPHWHKICEALPLLAQNLGPNPTLSGTNSRKRVPFVAQVLLKSGEMVKLLARSAENSAQFCTICDILHSPWHNHWQNHTLSGTQLVLKTLPLLAHCLKTLPFVAL